MPSYELTKMLYSSPENRANSIVPRRHVRSCIDFKCLPALTLDGERMSTVEGRHPSKGRNRCRDELRGCRHYNLVRPAGTVVQITLTMDTSPAIFLSTSASNPNFLGIPFPKTLSSTHTMRTQ
jgi:hypothetical protein